jgi:hypothetical protein
MHYRAENLKEITVDGLRRNVAIRNTFAFLQNADKLAKPFTLIRKCQHGMSEVLNTHGHKYYPVRSKIP